MGSGISSLWGDVKGVAEDGIKLLTGGGGHKTVQTVTGTSTAVANVMQIVNQSCINIINGGNVIDISGNFNIIDGLSQTSSISITSDCVGHVKQTTSLDTIINDAISQTSNDQEIALTQWLDNSKDTTRTNLISNITTNVSSTTSQTCVNDLDSKNIFIVSGSGNIVKGAAQKSAIDLISKCLLGQEQASSVINDMTNTVNQHSTYTSKNPFAFITDAIEGVMKSSVGVIAIIFIVLVCFIIVFKVLRHKKKLIKFNDYNMSQNDMSQQNDIAA